MKASSTLSTGPSLNSADIQKITGPLYAASGELLNLSTEAEHSLNSGNDPVRCCTPGE